MQWLVRLGLVCLFLLLACGPTEPKAECKVNGDCTMTERCDAGECKVIQCKSDGDCRGGYLCKDSQCDEADKVCPEKAKGGCCKDEDCESGEVCKDNKCNTSKCQSNDDCKDPTPKCLGDQCFAADACRDANDCTSATPKCKDGTCVALDAAKAGESCENNRPCIKNLVCNLEIGKPICRESCDPFNAICSAGTVCAYKSQDKGVCLPRINGNKEGEQCDTKPCENNLICVEWSGKSVCSKPCRAAQKDCGTGELCHDLGDVRACVPEPPRCGPGRPCSDKDWKCNNDGFCFPDRCPQTPCPGEKVCRRGRCQDLDCCQGDVCPGSKVCNHSIGRCTELSFKPPFCSQCLNNGSCAAANEKCIELTSKNDRICAAECTSSRKCDDEAMQCKAYGKKYYCVPTLGTCDRNRCKGVTCGEGEACLPATQQCVKTGLAPCSPCESDLQCGGPTDRCIRKDGKTKGICGRDCGGCATCPAGTICSDYENGKQCLPIGGTCS